MSYSEKIAALKDVNVIMGPWLDAMHRWVYRLGYPLARIKWRCLGGRAVGSAVVLLHADDILVVRESYRDGLGLPAGGRKGTETPLQTALREVCEEVGISLQADRLVHLYTVDFESDGRQITNSVFEAHLDGRIEPCVDRREIVWAGWMSRDEIGRADLQPVLRAYLLDPARATDRNGA
ncbi:MAG: NUDIX hydrolase [Geminicoccaceae bacterium]|nr:NUDIX hydrolase [Geminicoccaceae bacterium]